jgi:N-carbamoyl-L-amino-acid hydrolase
MRLVASLRNTDQSALDPKKTDLATTAAEMARRRDMGVAVEYVSSYPALPFDPTLLQRLRDAADAAGLKRRGLPTPIGHGALHVGRVVPSATLFIPCHGSISHNPAESITPAWAAAGLATLGPAVIETAGGIA